MVNITTAVEEDLQPVVDLLLVQLHEHRIPISRADLAMGVNAWLQDDRRGLILVAKSGSRAIGVSCVDFMWPLEHGGLAGWLEELYVLPEFRNAGVGSMLLEATLKECTARGCRALDLEVESDHVRVEGLYHRFGFTPIHSRRRWVKKLGPAEGAGFSG